MMDVKAALGKLRRRRQIPSGTTTYNGTGELGGHRFHLRVDSEEKGVLMVDASKLIFLNGTALDYIKCLLEGKTEEETVRFMRKRYRKLRKETAQDDHTKIKNQLVEYLKGDSSVVENIGTDSLSIGADDLPAPYRMDLALTYRCQNDCKHCYNETKDKPELSLEEWKQVVGKLWEAGIPHIVFTGGEPTLAPHLKELIMKSEELGQITGLITNGRKLKEKGYVKELVDVGLDHVQITLLSHRESVHDKLTGSEGAWKETVEGIKTALGEDLYVMTNTTIMQSTVDEIEEIMRFLIALGVSNIAFNSIIRSGKGKSAEGIDYERLTLVLTRLNAIAEEEGVNLIWYSPTPYCEFNPVNYGLGIKQCTACSINMAIEPDGTVLPCQSYYEPLGNILTDSWESIWSHELCKNIRERNYLPEKCHNCKLKEVCGGGCPLSLEHGDYLCLDRHSSV